MPTSTGEPAEESRELNDAILKMMGKDPYKDGL